jgi:D-glycero-D-manno-heptose 1,7-bisphosphate phosphatase
VNRGVILDRDGTLIEEVGYLDRIDRAQLFPYSVDAVRLLNRGGFVVIVVTNQAGIARGFFDEVFVEATHQSLSETLAAGGARVDAFYFCPHHPDGTVASYRQACDCRKPQPGLLRRAAAEHQLDLGRSFVVGDRAHDIAAGVAVGAQGVLVRTGYGDRADQSGHGAAAVVDNLMGAASWILRQP